jgi:hypothetical protein
MVAPATKSQEGDEMRRGILWGLVLACALALAAAPAPAREVDPVVLPPGTVTIIYSAQEANSILISQGRNTPSTMSWDQAASVSQIKTSQVEHYVRVYSYDSSRLQGGAVGSWMMRASSLRGLTAQEIKDVFALPSLPDYVTCIRVPTGTSLWTGSAGAISGWGDGGAQQMMLVDRIDASNYTYQRQLGQNALWYAPKWPTIPIEQATTWTICPRPAPIPTWNTPTTCWITWPRPPWPAPWNRSAPPATTP